MGDPDELDVEAHFDAVRDAVAGQKGWSLARNDMVLGFFSFGRFLMYHDLDPGAWPEDRRPEAHPVLGALLGEGFHGEPGSAVPEGTRIDDHVAPDGTCQVLDADSSQTLALLDVREGRNLVIQGPPGTGKSQTITNLIGEALGRGKKVLFVAEKMAALDVVKRRLDRVGLGDGVLELHSHKTKKTAVLDELGRTLKLGKPIVTGRESDLNALADFRERLNRYCDAVNRPVLASGIAPVEALGRLLLLGDAAKDLPDLDFAFMREWTEDDFREARIRVEEVERRVAELGRPADHPFHGTGLTALLPEDEAALKTKLDSTRKTLAGVAAAAKDMADALGVETPDEVDTLFKLRFAAACVLEAPGPDGHGSRPSRLDRRPGRSRRPLSGSHRAKGDPEPPRGHAAARRLGRGPETFKGTHRGLRRQVVEVPLGKLPQGPRPPGRVLPDRTLRQARGLAETHRRRGRGGPPRPRRGRGRAPGAGSLRSGLGCRGEIGRHHEPHGGRRVARQVQGRRGRGEGPRDHARLPGRRPGTREPRAPRHRGLCPGRGLHR